jgi:large subunit ribosomal protein L25
MATYLLKAKSRDITGKEVNQLREKDLIPAVLYGPDIENKNLTVNKNEFWKIYNQAGSSSLIDLQINDEAPVKILIQDYQTDPLTGDIIHIDFYQIKEGKKITTQVELEFIGEAPAVKELGGILVKSFDEIEIRCLPKDLEKVEKVQVDLSSLKTYSDAIYIKDLNVPEEIKITADDDELVALVSPPKEEEEEEPVPVEGEEAVAEAEEGAKKASGKAEEAKEEESKEETEK